MKYENFTRMVDALSLKVFYRDVDGYYQISCHYGGEVFYTVILQAAALKRVEGANATLEAERAASFEANYKPGAIDIS